MKKYIIAALMTIAGMAASFAQSTVGETSLNINTKNGDTTTFRFTVDPVATIEGTSLVITTINGDRVEYPFENIANLTFVTDESSVEGVEGVATKVYLTKEAISLAGLGQGVAVTLYDMAGRKVASAKADSEGNAVVSLRELTPGAYAVAAGNQSFKIIK